MRRLLSISNRATLSAFSALGSALNSYGPYCALCERPTTEQAHAVDPMTLDESPPVNGARTALVVCLDCAVNLSQTDAPAMTLPTDDPAPSPPTGSEFVYELITVAVEPDDGTGRRQDELVIVTGTTPAAANTVAVFALNTPWYDAERQALRPPTAEAPSLDDRRLVLRTRAWLLAQDFAAAIGDNTDEPVGKQFRAAAAASGFLSVWTTVLVRNVGLGGFRRLVGPDPESEQFFAGTDWERLGVDTTSIARSGGAKERTSTRQFGTVLSTDVVDSTQQSLALDDANWQAVLDSRDRIARGLVDQHGGRLVKGIGDGVLAVFKSPSQGVACGIEMVQALAGIGVEIRAGVHAGEIEVHENGDISGSAVNLAARLVQHATDGELWTSSTVRDSMFGGNAAFTDRGEFDLKGTYGSWRLFSVRGE